MRRCNFSSLVLDQPRLPFSAGTNVSFMGSLATDVPGQLLTSNRQEGDLDNDRYGSRADIDERPFEGLLFGSGRSRASGACRRQMRAVGLPLDLSNRQCWPSDVMDRNNRGVGDAAVAIAVCSGRTRAGTAKRSLHTSNSARTIVGWGDHSWTVDGASGGTRPE